jgi:myo-inositol-1(or 4)-monophosphatase
MDYTTICNKTINLVRVVGDYLRRERAQLKIEAKGKNDFVTHLDKASEEHLVSGLKQILPGSGFIAEEGTVQEGNEVFKWIIDPIDGTTNFIHGAPPYCISVALQEKDELVAGVVYEIVADECFYASKGSKAYLNGETIQVSETGKVENALLATGFPYSDFGRMQAFMETMDYLFHHSHGVRRLGSAAADLAYVACGRYDGFYEYHLKPWDVAAGAFLVQQAGGKLADFRGGDDYIYGQEVVAANSNLFEEFRMVIGNIMNKV